MDKCQREKENLYQWSKNYENEKGIKHLSEIDKNMESYYVFKNRQGEYLKEYYFETMPELKKELDGLWKGNLNRQDIMKTILVSAMKNKPQKQDNIDKKAERKGDFRDTERMPTFIYNF